MVQPPNHKIGGNAKPRSVVQSSDHKKGGKAKNAKGKEEKESKEQKASHADVELDASLAGQTMKEEVREETATLATNAMVNDSNDNMGMP